MDRNNGTLMEINGRTSGINHLHGADPSWQADSHSSSQEIPRLLWNTKFITMFIGVRH
jgi:hypothetical protein